MRMRLFFKATLLLASLAVLLPAQAALPAADSQGQPIPTLAPMLKKVTPAVVNIAVSATHTINSPLLNDPVFRHFFGVPQHQQPRQNRNSAGSGVIVDAEQGLIITNHHVVKDADEITIGLSDGRTIVAELVGSDPQVDIAVLQIQAKGLTALHLADSNTIEVGDFVVAIGNPFNLGQTVTTGIISALGRTGLNRDHYENFIQTDASINPGNSGGALVNLRGELVGINTAIIAPAGGNVGIGFAIPTKMVLASKEQIMQYGEVRRGRIGVVIQDLSLDLAQAFGLDEHQQGVLVSQVEAKAPADKAGVKVEDIIIAVDDEPIRSVAQLRNSIAMKRIGEKAKLTLIRNGKEQQLKVRIGEQANTQALAKKNDEESQAAVINKLAGVHLRNSNEGVTVVALEGEARSTGLRVNDVILAANRQAIRTINDLRKALKSSQSDNFLLQIKRNNSHLFLIVR